MTQCDVTSGKNTDQDEVDGATVNTNKTQESPESLVQKKPEKTTRVGHSSGRCSVILEELVYSICNKILEARKAK